MTNTVRGKKVIFVDSEESLVSLIDHGFIKFEGKKYFNLYTDAIRNKLLELEKTHSRIKDLEKSVDSWKNSYYDEKERTRNLEHKLLELDDKDSDVSIDGSGRNGHGRFVRGNKIDQPRDNTGRFVKKDK